MANVAFSSCSSTSLMASAPRLPAMTASPLASSRSAFISAAGSGTTAPARKSLVIGHHPPGRRRIGGLGCRCMFGLGVPELFVIAGVATLVFGPKKLPEIGRSFGKTMKSFQEAAREFEIELKKGPQESTKPSPDEHSKAFISEEVNKELGNSSTENSI